MKRTAFIPLATVLVVAAIVIASCEKTVPHSPATPGAANVSARYVGGHNWNTLWYFGTYDYSGCVTPCGMCHTSQLQNGYVPNGDDPQNNEALTEISVMAGNRLLVSVDLSDVGEYYVNDIMTTGHLNVSTFGAFPQDVVNAACDAASIPHWGGPVGMTAAHYPVAVESTAEDARLEIEGTYDSATGWSWMCFVR